MRMLVFSAAAIAALSATSPAAAACSDDLVKADQNIHRTRAELQNAASAAAPAKCAPSRNRGPSPTSVRKVCAKGAPGPTRAKNAAATNAALVEVTRQM